MGGMLGIVLLGVFADTAVNPAGAQGLIHGSGRVLRQATRSCAGCSLYAFVFTYAML